MKRKFYQLFTLIGAILLVIFVTGRVSAQIISQYVETNSGTVPKGIEVLE